MISVSDNSATNIIIDRVGMENVNALLDSLGLTHMRLRRKMMDLKAAGEGRENVASPREFMLLLEALYRGKVLNKQFTEDFFKLLSVHKESYIPRELPEGLRVANKPGELEGVRNDSGIVFTGSRPFVISVMTTYLRRERDGGDAIVRISTAAYRMFDRLSRASEYTRVPLIMLQGRQHATRLPGSFLPLRARGTTKSTDMTSAFSKLAFPSNPQYWQQN